MSEQHSLHGLGFRPTEYLEIGEPVESVTARLRAGLQAEGDRLDTRWAGEHVLFALAPRERRVWSPWLSVALREQTNPEAAGTTVVAQFCPHPQLWTAVMLTNIGLASIGVLAIGFGWAQMVLERPAWAWWIVLASGMGALVLWLGSHAARHLARGQMHELWEALTTALAPDDRGS